MTTRNGVAFTQRDESSGDDGLSAEGAAAAARPLIFRPDDTDTRPSHLSNNRRVRRQAKRVDPPESVDATRVIARSLRRLRRRRNLDASEVGSVTGWTSEHVEALEAGAIAPLLSEVVTLAWLYGVEVERFRPGGALPKGAAVRRGTRRNPVADRPGKGRQQPTRRTVRSQGTSPITHSAELAADTRGTN